MVAYEQGREIVYPFTMFCMSSLLIMHKHFCLSFSYSLKIPLRRLWKRVYAHVGAILNPHAIVNAWIASSLSCAYLSKQNHKHL